MGLDKQLRISCTMTNSNLRNVKIWVRLRHNLLDTQIVNLLISLSEKLKWEDFRDGCISYKECLRKSVRRRQIFSLSAARFKERKAEEFTFWNTGQ